ncbi:MAG: hypothetical protein JWM80_2815 [Cyanobacteria bacterium RYN_339]|nr:hypothetical protein [Cyanobacteria bacterium RYN_339]
MQLEMHVTEAPGPLEPFADAVRIAYQAAVAARWEAGTRAPLWDAAVAAVRAYGALPGAAEQARRFHLLLVDLAADATPPEMAAWPAEHQQAVRQAATRALASPGKPHHRPRAQSLLKRLDMLAEPTLAAREQVLLALSRHRQALHRLQPRTGPDARRVTTPLLQARAALLTRLTDVVRDLPRTRLTPAETPAYMQIMARLQTLAEQADFLDAPRQGQVFELMQQAMAPERDDLMIAPALAALEEVRAQVHPGVLAARLELVEMIFDMTLADFGSAQVEALRGHLGEVAHVARHLMEIPQGNLPPLLFRLRQRLADPGNEVIEPLIDEAIATLERLEGRRSEIAATTARLERTADEDLRRELLVARQRKRELDALVVAMLGLRLAGLGAPEAPGVQNLFRQAEALADARPVEPAAAMQAIAALAQQLERPRLTTDRVWQAGSTALQQLLAQRQLLEETLRGLALDRHLEPGQRMARQHLLQRQLEALDYARLVFASLPFDGITAEGEALGAIQAFTLAVRQVLAGYDTAALRSALDRVVKAVGADRS